MDTAATRSVAGLHGSVALCLTMLTAVISSLCVLSLLAPEDNLAVVFKKFDVNGDGQLGADEIAEMMRHIGKTDGDLEAQKLMDAMDEDGDGGVR